MIDPTGTITLLIDGTGSREWLCAENNPKKLKNGRWLTHLANWYEESEEKKKNLFYYYGPDSEILGSDLDSLVESIIDSSYKDVCDRWCVTKEPIFMLGCSRGGLGVNEVARKLNDKGCKCEDGIYKPVPVAFLGLFDPVDMTYFAGTSKNYVPPNVEEAVVIYGEEPKKSNETFQLGASQYAHYCGVDFDSGIETNWPRMKHGETPGSKTRCVKVAMNATHAAIGGCPGYSSCEPSPYHYEYDRACSIKADILMRKAAKSAGCPIPVISSGQYGFPLDQSQLPPVKEPQSSWWPW